MDKVKSKLSLVLTEDKDLPLKSDRKIGIPIHVLEEIIDNQEDNQHDKDIEVDVKEDLFQTKIVVLEDGTEGYQTQI